MQCTAQQQQELQQQQQQQNNKKLKLKTGKKELPNRENHLWKSRYEPKKNCKKNVAAKCWKIQCDNNVQGVEGVKGEGEKGILWATCVCRLLHELLLLLHTCVHNALVLSSPARANPFTLPLRLPHVPCAPLVPF